MSRAFLREFTLDTETSRNKLTTTFTEFQEANNRLVYFRPNTDSFYGKLI